MRDEGIQPVVWGSPGHCSAHPYGRTGGTRGGHTNARGAPHLLPAVLHRDTGTLPCPSLSPEHPLRRPGALPEGTTPRGSGDLAPAPGELVRMTQPLLDPDPSLKMQL